jgi:hypothetical protein
MAMLMLLMRMQRDLTVDGFRSTFHDWIAEKTNTEMALARTSANKAEAAHRRGDLFEQSRRDGVSSN